MAHSSLRYKNWTFFYFEYFSRHVGPVRTDFPLRFFFILVVLSLSTPSLEYSPSLSLPALPRVLLDLLHVW
ncbi:hypothetical protein BDV33DRAFT_175189 [Aspergillus novoparasiticus]|uniref:Uncharacterized protein n=1 Tax=Aspergillus novoparasiticus TaxID=986946 RepID=A0A5N6EP70_9EURO|nr:hypothetical protein BDV33DRAFT_175189 [Aspergillus novoparasiticus]